MTVVVSHRMRRSDMHMSYQCHISDQTCLRLPACVTSHLFADHRELQFPSFSLPVLRRAWCSGLCITVSFGVSTEINGDVAKPWMLELNCDDDAGPESLPRGAR